MRVLITAGGTEEPIDGVRRLSNVSTGATGGVLAQHFAEQGAEVLLVHAARAPLDVGGVEHSSFVSFADLEASLQRNLRERDFDAVIHLAAVSDYSVATIEADGVVVPSGGRGKIPSGSELVIRLTPNRKLIDDLRGWSRNNALSVVGFKLTNEPDPSARAVHVRALLDRGVADLVVHNDLADIDDETHPAVIWTQRGPIARTSTKIELAEALFALLDRPQDFRRRPASRRGLRSELTP